MTKISTASAIDLAGSEDNRRTDNGKERMVESASINKSLFVLAQCVEAMSKKQQRIPYRESKMTRILSLGQNNGLTVMILNLAPVRSYHLDTLSSLNFANRTKKIEAREIENEPIFKGSTKLMPVRPPATRNSSAPRQPLRSLTSCVNANLSAHSKKDQATTGDGKPVKAFSVYSDKPQPPTRIRRSEPPKRPSSHHPHRPHADISASKIEEMVEKKVAEILAARASNEQSNKHVETNGLNEQVQHRLELLEHRIELGIEDVWTEGHLYLLAAKQHQAAGKDLSALEDYRRALPFFPQNEKLVSKIALLEERTSHKTAPPRSQHGATAAAIVTTTPPSGASDPITMDVDLEEERVLHAHPRHQQQQQQEEEEEAITDKSRARRRHRSEDSDVDYEESEDDNQSSSDEDEYFPKRRQPSTAANRNKKRVKIERNSYDEEQKEQQRQKQGNGNDFPHDAYVMEHQLLSIVNSRDVNQIKSLKGVGSKRAEAIVERLCEMDIGNAQRFMVNSLSELSQLKGIGAKMVESMSNGLMF